MPTKRTLLKAVIASGTALVPVGNSARAVSYADYMLNMINLERRKAGVSEVKLGTNVAAQRHAENMVKFCHYGHWGVDGTLPYMRYSLAGGCQRNVENVTGFSFCHTDQRETSHHIGHPMMMLYWAMGEFIASPGHKSNILDVHHTAVNVGIAHDAHNFRVVQHFESDYVEMPVLPYLSDGVLNLQGLLRHVDIIEDIDHVFTVSYDPPPKLLALGQLLRAASYPGGMNAGKMATIITDKQVTSDAKFEWQRPNCRNPYNVVEDAQPASNAQEASLIFREAKQSACTTEKLTSSVRTADMWNYTIGERTFSIKSDISDVLEKNGPGVYTVSMVTIPGSLVVWQHSIFHDVEPPEGYTD